jgi:hypothetical protein
MPMERVAGIEPASQAWKASALPLSYTRLLVSAAERLPQRDRAGQCLPVPGERIAAPKMSTSGRKSAFYLDCAAHD